MKPTLEDVAKWHEAQAELSQNWLRADFHTAAAAVIREAMGEIDRNRAAKSQIAPGAVTAARMLRAIKGASE